MNTQHIQGKPSERVFKITLKYKWVGMNYVELPNLLVSATTKVKREGKQRGFWQISELNPSKLLTHFQRKVQLTGLRTEKLGQHFVTFKLQVTARLDWALGTLRTNK